MRMAIAAEAAPTQVTWPTGPGSAWSIPRFEAHRCLHRFLPAFVKIVATLLRHSRLELAVDRPARGDILLVFPESDRQAGEIRRTLRGGLLHLRPQQGHVEY